MEPIIIIYCIIGGVIGIGLGILMDYWDKREYYKIVRRNKRKLKNETQKT